MPSPALRVDWSDALDDIEVLQGVPAEKIEQLIDSVERMAALGWSLGHPTDEPGVRYWSVPPLGILYRVRGHELLIRQVVNPRRLRRPLW